MSRTARLSSPSLSLLSLRSRLRQRQDCRRPADDLVVPYAAGGPVDMHRAHHRGAR